LEIKSLKEFYESESAVKIARRSEAVTSRQLQQVGLEPALIRSVTSDVDIVMADVPEGRLTQVKVGQECICHFFGLPHEAFVGKVKSIAPVLSKERRSLRVLLVIDDHEDQLRPGMFAEIGLGTDPREALLMPADGVLHIARTDYVLVAAGENMWKVTEVQVGEPHNGEVEILDGLKPGEKVLGKGAILLKPMVIRSLLVHSPSQSPPSVVAPSAGTNP
jgi:multidrug efflux pump subunit AcrA (membrane-fusion protein)